MVFIHNVMSIPVYTYNGLIMVFHKCNIQKTEENLIRPNLQTVNG